MFYRQEFKNRKIQFTFLSSVRKAVVEHLIIDFRISNTSTSAVMDSLTNAVNKFT